ncbi:MAG: hypothetical protein GF365_04755 [Candidatus Buchananbacteria bacterium]|nr:hypothetical protein [Candidatus Buchananbacteria bacterium]
MKYPKNRNIHRPPHLFFNNTIYFISCRTFKKHHLFNSKDKINIIKNRIDLAVIKYEVKLFAWVILFNHYHLLLEIKHGLNLSKMINFINGGTSYDLNKLENKSGRKIWANYWDYCIRDEKDFWTHFNYIHQNPIKHGLVKNLEELKDYEYCSYQWFLKEKGEEWLSDCFINYPVRDDSF